jgi:hypothetical protein
MVLRLVSEDTTRRLTERSLHHTGVPRRPLNTLILIAQVYSTRADAVRIGGPIFYELQIHRRPRLGRFLGHLQPTCAGGTQAIPDVTGVSRLGTWIAQTGANVPAGVSLFRWDAFASRDYVTGCSHYVDRVLNGEVVDVYGMSPLSLHCKVAGFDEKRDAVELRIQDVHGEETAEAVAVWAEYDLPHLSDKGATLLGAFHILFGGRIPRLILFLSWEDVGRGPRAWESLDILAPRLQRLRSRSLLLGRPLFGRYQSWLMRSIRSGELGEAIL